MLLDNVNTSFRNLILLFNEMQLKVALSECFKNK